MENASKALLIAAAVLIVILLIAFGMRILNSTGDVSDQVAKQSASTDMQTFNAQFSAYKGTQNPSAIRNMVVFVNSSNTSNLAHKVEIECNIISNSKPVITADAAGKYTVDSALDSANSAKVTFEYDSTGYINKIIVGA